ncbi:MAG: prolipoprotein diacylglyceryl transferase [Bacteroidetes bacterium]|nr:prolipoprotein diacylglyceryl transferase [Bacteroidota bacterium]
MNNLVLSITWDVNPRIFETEYISPAWYGLLFALALMASYRVVSKFFKLEGQSEEQLDKLAWYTILGTVIGARLGHVFFYGPLRNVEFNGQVIRTGYLDNPIDILKIWEGGLASHGAAIAILISLYLYYRFSGINKPYLWIVDRIAVVSALGGTFVRIGNLINSEIVGKPTELPWGFHFVRNYDYGDVPRHPTQLYEALCYIVIFFVLYRIYKNFKGQTPNGLLLGLFLTLTFTARFCIEFLKEVQVDSEYDLLAEMGLNMGQILSIPLVLIGLGLSFWAYSKRKLVQIQNDEPQIEPPAADQDA